MKMLNLLNRLSPLMMLSLLLISLLSGCVTYQKCQDKFGTGQTLPEVKAGFAVTVPGDTNTIGFSQEQLNAMPVGSSFVSSPFKASLLDSLAQPVTTTLKRTGKNTWDCTGATETKLITGTVPCDCPEVNNFRPDPEIITKVPWWSQVLLWSFGLALLMQTGRVAYFKYKLNYSRPSMPDNGLPNIDV